MANNTDKKGVLKATAEVAATTSTILVASKTIASVIDSTASSVKDMYVENVCAQESNDVVSQENSPESNIQEISTSQEVINESINHQYPGKKYISSVEEESYSNAEDINEDIVSEPVEEITEDADTTEDDAVSIISTELLDEKLGANFYAVGIDEKKDSESSSEGLEYIESGIENISTEPLCSPLTDDVYIQKYETIENFLSE